MRIGLNIVNWIFFVLIILCVMTFMMGYHNFDLGHNLNYINEACDGVTFNDKAGDGVTYDSYGLIYLGVNQMMTGFFVMIITMIFYVSTKIYMQEDY